MKVALVHDYIKEYGGAERVLEAFHEIWPEAPVFTTLYLPEFLGPHKERFTDWDIRVSWLQRIPYIHKLISIVRILSPRVFKNWDFQKFDLVIVSATGAYFPNLINKKNAIHICYCHTPPRYLYGYPTARNWKKHITGRLIGELINHFVRMTDFESAQKPDFFIANSREVKKRIEKFYRREAEVIYPPVETSSKFKVQSSKLKKRKITYYLTGGRLARAKRVDLAIEACNKLKLPLKVFGKAFAEYGSELQAIAGPTIEFLGEISDEELLKVYYGAKAFIYPSEYEDFGIIAVEAQSHGIPVIGLNQGGIKETVIEGKTGVLFDKPEVEDVIKAIRRFSHLTIKSEDCIVNARRFSKERFKREIQEYITKIFSQKS